MTTLILSSGNLQDAGRLEAALWRGSHGPATVALRPDGVRCLAGIRRKSERKLSVYVRITLDDPQRFLNPLLLLSVAAQGGWVRRRLLPSVVRADRLRSVARQSSRGAA